MGSFTYTMVSPLKWMKLLLKAGCVGTSRITKYIRIVINIHITQMVYGDIAINSISNLQNLLATNNVHKTEVKLVIAIGYVGDEDIQLPYCRPCCKDEILSNNDCNASILMMAVLAGLLHEEEFCLV